MSTEQSICFVTGCQPADLLISFIIDKTKKNTILQYYNFTRIRINDTYKTFHIGGVHSLLQCHSKRHRDNTVVVIQYFINNYFGKLRVIVKDGKVWFSLADACKALEIANPSQVKTRLDLAGLISNEGCSTSVNQYGCKSVRTIKMTFINEANLYRRIFQNSWG